MVETMVPLASIGHIAGLMIGYMVLFSLVMCYLSWTASVRQRKYNAANARLDCAAKALAEARAEYAARYIPMAIHWRLDFAERQLKKLKADLGRAGTKQCVAIGNDAEFLVTEANDCRNHIATRDELTADSGTLRSHLDDAPIERDAELAKIRQRFEDEDRAREAYRAQTIAAVQERWEAQVAFLSRNQQLLAAELAGQTEAR